MLHEVLKLVTYLIVLTTTTSSTYLSKESVVNYRRASPSSIPSEQSSQLSSDGEGFEWTELSNVDSPQSQPQSDYLIPKLVNVNNMLYTQLNSGISKSLKRNSNKKQSQRVRGKKDNNNKLINSKNNKLTNLIKNYDNLNKRNNVASSYSEESNNVRNDTVNVQTTEEDSKFNLTSNSQNLPDSPSRHPFPLTNEYPINQISTETEHDRELQQLFGIEGAKKYQNYQLQQQMLNVNEQYPLTPDDEGIELKEPQKKRSGEMNGEEMQDVSGAMVNQIMPRTTRRQREYDVPLIRKFITSHLFIIQLSLSLIFIHQSLQSQESSQLPQKSFLTKIKHSVERLQALRRFHYLDTKKSLSVQNFP